MDEEMKELAENMSSALFPKPQSENWKGRRADKKVTSGKIQSLISYPSWGNWLSSLSLKSSRNFSLPLPPFPKQPSALLSPIALSPETPYLFGPA